MSALLSKLELKLPPLLQLGLFGLMMAGLDATWPDLRQTWSGREILAASLAALGAWIALLGVLAFRQAQTTVDPRQPEQSSALVVHGIYRRSRNPMYVGFMLALAGWGVWLGHPVAALLVPLFALSLSRLQIQPEERLMLEKFGASYADYCRQVRRWL